MTAKQRSLFDAKRNDDDIVFIAIRVGREAVTNDDGTIKLFATRDDADAAKGPLGTSAAVAMKNLPKALYGAKMPKGE